MSAELDMSQYLELFIQETDEQLEVLEQEVVISSLSRFCGHISGISGATILGDGNVALIVDVNGVVP